VGYTYITDLNDPGSNAHENRGILELTQRIPLRKRFSLVNRGHMDLRDKDGNHSTRYRYRLAVEREVVAFGKPAAPFVNAEFSYDPRYDTWNQNRYQVGTEVTHSK